MVLLSTGTPLSWEDTKNLADHVRFRGITQFLHGWDRTKDRCGDELFWGDEVLGHELDQRLGYSPYLKIEYMVASFDDEARSARLSLRQQETLAKLEATAHGASFCSPDK